MSNLIIEEFISQCVHSIEENTRRIEKCLGEIEEAHIWKYPNNTSNSFGNILLHLSGNIRQYIISALGEIIDNRERDKEFSTREGFTKSELFNKLITTVQEATGIIRQMDEDSLIKIYPVQGFNLSGIGIIIHVTEHYSYHTGQVAFWAKQLINKDLGFYAGINLNNKNG